MGWFSKLLGEETLAFALRTDPLELAAGPRFDAITQADIPPEFYGLPSYSDPLAPSPRVDRASALQVPAVKRGRDLIAGTLGTLPINLEDLTGSVDPGNPFAALLKQPEVGIPRSVTFANTFEDMLFEKVAWWLVVETGWHGYPTRVRRLDPRSVDVRKNGKVYVTKAGHHGQVTEYADDFDLIRFDSPNEGLLVAGARAIRTCLALDAAANRYASGNQPLDYFTPADEADPDQDELDAALDAWEVARRARTTGYVPGWLKYSTAGWNPEQLQLADARQHATLELSRLMGIDPEDLGVSTTSRTYQNSQDRYQSRIKDTLRGYYVAFEERLSMNDVNPRGYRARFDFSDLTRADDMARFQAYNLGLRVGVYTDTNDVRKAEGKPPTATPKPAQETTNVPA